MYLRVKHSEGIDNKNKTEYNLQYTKEKLIRISLDVQREKYEEIAATAVSIGESVNGYIKKAIDMCVESERSE